MLPRCGSLLLFVAFTSPAGEPDVLALFQKVASVYGASSNYVVRVQSSNTGKALSAGVGDPRLTQPDLLAVNSITVARSGKAMRYEIKSGVTGHTTIWITDGLREWRFRPAQRQYTESPAMAWPVEAGPGPGLPGIDWTYFSKFRALPGVILSASLLRMDTTCNGPTAVIEIRISQTEDRIIERLSIRTDTGRVCHSEVHRIRSGRGGIVTEERVTSWTYEQIGGPVDPALFVFEPPKDAKLVKKLDDVAP